ncbi:MAG: hypothetical protein DHS20C16_34410 [Phycisphaerae bacterium]|nr:MAG: hypothetical protein DHS20C16_34410 [Phycisphaerae bacterium]
MSQDRVRLKITPKNAKPNKVGCLHEWTVSVDVINLSAFPVTIEEVGFELETKEHMIQQPMESLNRGLLPIRLDSREALMILYPAKFLDDPRFAEVRTAYARCQCGTTRHGSSKALKQLVENAREKRQSE